MNQYTAEEMEILCKESSDRGLYLKMFFFDLGTNKLYSDEDIFRNFFDNDPILPSATIQTDDGSSIHVKLDKKAIQNAMYYEDLNMMPLYINDPLMGIFARWRLKIGR